MPIPEPAAGEQDVSPLLVDLTVQAAFSTIAELSRVAAAHDLSLTQLRVLGILRDRQVRIGRLVDFLGLEKSTLTGLIDRAERRGLLRRVRNEGDRRVVEVTLSDHGLDLAERLVAEIADRLRPRLAALGPADGETLRVLLASMHPEPDPDTPALGRAGR